MDISNASVLVTGGAGGFGGATSRRLAEMGARVVIADMADERGEALAKELGNGSVYVRTDIMDNASIANAVKTAVDIGPLRAAVKDGVRLSYAHFAHNVHVFLTSAFEVSALCAEAMAKNDPLDSNQRGVIINTASIAGFEGTPGQVPYGAAKGGIIAMALNMARDLAPIGIRSMAIAPGTFLTLAYKGMGSDEEVQAKFGPQVPNPKRMGYPDEYARLAAHIVDNDFLNGTTIRIDGAQRFNA